MRSRISPAVRILGVIAALIVLVLLVLLSPHFDLPRYSPTPTRPAFSAPSPFPTLRPVLPKRPTAMRVPSQTPTPTLVPGPEMLSYLPAAADLPQCKAVQYTQTQFSAELLCTLQTRGAQTLAILLASKAFSADSLALPTSYQPLDLPSLGDQSSAGKNQRGDQAVLLFIRNKVRVKVVISTPNLAVPGEDLLALARRLDGPALAEIHPPLPLEFSAVSNPDGAAAYFSTSKFATLNQGQEQASSDFGEKSNVCLSLAPLKPSRDLWSVYLFDKTRNVIVRKVSGEMITQKVCAGLSPSYPAGTFKAGDAYELRLVVGQDWVATYGFVTR